MRIISGLGVVTILGVCASAGGALLLWSGAIDVAAVNAGGPQDRILAYASTRSIRHHAKAGKNPLADDAAALRLGLDQYRTLCAPCHGGPGVAPAEFAAGLHPAPPDLASAEVQAFTDGMLYRAISGGIGSTGMPGFGPAHTEGDLWGLVTVVRHLRTLSPGDKRLLGAHEAAAPAPAAIASGTADGHTHRVSITGFKFAPEALEVPLGDAVEWTNEDFVAHTATAQNRTFDTGTLDAGGTKRILLTKKGTFPYFCRFHVAMKGTLIVH